MIVAPLPDIVMLCKFPDPMTVFTNNITISELILMTVLLSIKDKAEWIELQKHIPTAQHLVEFSPLL